MLCNHHCNIGSRQRDNDLSTLAEYVVLFSKAMLITAFGFSFLGKVRDIHQFRRTVSNFHLVPESLIDFVVPLVLASELLTVILLLAHQTLASLGFVLAIVQLTLFSLALLYALIRKLNISCNCFGADDRTISPFNLIRNGGFLFFAIAGVATLLTLETYSLSFVETSIATLFAVPFAILWIEIEGIVQILRQ
jgi:hypothetical protein